MGYCDRGGSIFVGNGWPPPSSAVISCTRVHGSSRRRTSSPASHSAAQVSRYEPSASWCWLLSSPSMMAFLVASVESWCRAYFVQAATAAATSAGAIASVSKVVRPMLPSRVRRSVTAFNGAAISSLPLAWQIERYGKRAERLNPGSQIKHAVLHDFYSPSPLGGRGSTERGRGD